MSGKRRPASRHDLPPCVGPSLRRGDAGLGVDSLAGRQWRFLTRRPISAAIEAGRRGQPGDDGVGFRMLLSGKCHCGNIAFTLEWQGDPPLIPARACTCTFCVKHGGVWTSNPNSSLAVTVQDASRVSQYAFGSRTATFHVCSHCGSVPLVTSEIGGRLYAVVNVNVLENIDPDWLQRATANFEGEDIESRLARRTRNWIADVRWQSKPAGVAAGREA